MRWARGLVLILAIGSAAGAAAIARKAAHTPPPAQPQRPLPRIEILVAARFIPAGELVEAKDIRWQPWPASGLPRGAIRHAAGAPAPHFDPAPARYPLLEGEPLAEAKLARPGNGGLMAALIAPGMRAVAIPVREESAAGGLIQPNDRVDVLWTPQTTDHPDRRPETRTLLRAAKVLAIGRSTEARGRGAEGRTATLELTPNEAKLVAGARTSGEISLSLIAAADAAALPQHIAEAAQEDKPAPTIRIMKFGRQPDGAWGNRRGPQ